MSGRTGRGITDAHGMGSPPGVRPGDDGAGHTAGGGSAGVWAVLLEPKLAQRRMASSYFKRMLLLAAVLAAGFTLPVFDPLAAVLPLFFPKLALTIGTIYFGKGGN